MVGLSKLSVHDRIEHGVDAAVEPGEVGTEHVQYLWGAVAFVGYIEQQEGDKTEDKTQENGEAHACRKAPHQPQLALASSVRRKEGLSFSIIN